MRRHYAKNVLDEKIINVERLVAVLFDVGKKYGVQVRNGNGLSGITGKCLSRNEHFVVLESESFDGFSKETIKHEHTFKTGEILTLWEITE